MDTTHEVALALADQLRDFVETTVDTTMLGGLYMSFALDTRRYYCIIRPMHKAMLAQMANVSGTSVKKGDVQ